MVLLVVLAAGAVAALTTDLPSVGQLRADLDEGGLGTRLLLVAGSTAVLLAPVPRSVVSVLLGGLLGFGAGLTVAMAAGMLAAVAAFALSRGLGRQAALQWAGPRLNGADRSLTERGFAWVLTARLIPVLPFAVVSYGAGLSGVRPAPFLAATAVGLVPSTVVQVGLGASVPLVAGWVDGGAAALLVVLAVLLLAGAGWWWHRRRARRGGAS
ncbi:TVP38/TMEM64 family protein [Blastococcus xanthinilyticus]|uniref:TVP38/TMEM64 family protein n=1 Tax=Blastococcus xanthinilyticus TaxID=1564164 RepID=UPI0014125924|nr:VTT domain-containing protein [Blastococcus xanthinilyticus]